MKWFRKNEETLLLHAGITSMASLLYKAENDLLEGTEDTGKDYMEDFLPNKMKYNLTELEKRRNKLTLRSIELVKR